MVHGLYENTYANKLCNFISNMHELSCQSKKQVMVMLFETGALVSFVANGPLVFTFFHFLNVDFL